MLEESNLLSQAKRLFSQNLSLTEIIMKLDFDLNNRITRNGLREL